MKDYKLSEIRDMCRRFTCETCPVFCGHCPFGSTPNHWLLDDENPFLHESIQEQNKTPEPQDGPDQTIKADAGKLPLTAVPRAIIRAIGEVRYYGMSKYPNGGIDNWKRVDPQRYRDAVFRHFLAYLDDPDGYDEESGLPHLWHLACNIAFLIELDKEGKR